MPLLDFLGPLGFDPGQRGDNIRIGQRAFKGRHVRFEVLEIHGLCRSEFGDPEKQFVVVMPGVTGFIMGWGFERAVGIARLPILLPLRSTPWQEAQFCA